MTTWLGDYTEDTTVHFIWSTNDANGASITRATNGTVSVYKDNGATQSTAGITDTEDFDSLTGIHACTIDLSSDAFYATGSDYAVVLSGATIDGQSVNAVLAHFSIENRFKEVTVTSMAADTITASAIATDAIGSAELATSAVDEIRDSVLSGAIAEPSGIFTWPATLSTILQWLGAVSRNKITQTETTQTIRNDADAADIAASTLSDDGTTFTRGEFT